VYCFAAIDRLKMGLLQLSETQSSLAVIISGGPYASDYIFYLVFLGFLFLKAVSAVKLHFT
jgi:hypothetical protein